MRGLCNKEDKCDYLHEEGGNSWHFQQYLPAEKIDETCPYYSLGFCRDGSLCGYNHTILNETEVKLIILLYLTLI